MTYRDRRLARVERLTEWAGKREDKAAALHERNAPYRGDVAFNTQPGHIPERARAIARTERAFEHEVKAEQMTAKAANIAAQVEHAIYDDDPDAIERLEQRLVGLEARRDAIKAENAAYRKANKAELADLTAWGRNQQMPYPGYILTNLTGNIGRQRQRLELLKRRAAAE